jgi:hypothetical protein
MMWNKNDLLLGIVGECAKDFLDLHVPSRKRRENLLQTHQLPSKCLLCSLLIVETSVLMAAEAMA